MDYLNKPSINEKRKKKISFYPSFLLIYLKIPYIRKVFNIPTESFEAPKTLMRLKVIKLEADCEKLFVRLIDIKIV